jgi:hypothetical protein
VPLGDEAGVALAASTATGDAMRTVISAFTRRDAARQAATALREAGLTRGAVAVRSRDAGGDPSLGHPLDEVVTGGALTDFVWLLEQLFGTSAGGPAQGHPSTADIVGEGGAVVVVAAADDDEAARVQAFLLDAGASAQAHLPREGDLD